MRGETVRLTKTTIAVLEALLAASEDRPVWGRYIAERADMETSSVSVILKRLRELGWIESWWEDTSTSGGHPRQFHELTPVGYRRAMRALVAREERRRKIFG